MTFYFTLWFLLSSVFPCLFSAVNFHRGRHLYLAGRPHVGHRPTFYLVVKATTMIMIITIASVLWHCWLGIRKSIQPVKKTEWWGAGVVICGKRRANPDWFYLSGASLPRSSWNWLIDSVKVFASHSTQNRSFWRCSPSQSWLGMKKLNLTQQKHTFINQK